MEVCGQLIPNCLIDTGSSCTVIRKTILQRLNIEIIIIGEPLLVRCFMGNIVSCNSVCLLQLKVDEVSGKDVRALVLDDSLLSYDIIVGCDFINQSHIVMIKYRDGLHFLNRLNLIQEIQTSENSKLYLSKISFGNLGRDQVLQCFKLLCQYEDRVTFSLSDLGRAEQVEMHIRLKSDQPVVYRPYRMSLTEKGVLSGLLQELLENKIIRESSSPYASPILLVKKKQAIIECVSITENLIR